MTTTYSELETSQWGDTDRRYCFFYCPRAGHQKTWALVTSALSAPPSNSELFSVEDKNRREKFIHQKRKMQNKKKKTSKCLYFQVLAHKTVNIKIQMFQRDFTLALADIETLKQCHLSSYTALITQLPPPIRRHANCP